MADIILSAEFEKTIRDEREPVLIDVFGDGCAPCDWIAPVVDDLAKDLKGQARIVKLDRGEARNTAGDAAPVLKFMQEHGIRGIPALMLFDKGEYKDTLMGGPHSKKEIREWMEKTLGRKFNAASAGPVCENYGIVIENLPLDPDKMFETAGDIYSSVTEILIDFYRTDDVQQIAIGPLKAPGTLSGIKLIISRHAAQALADALPDEHIIDAEGKRVEPSMPKRTPIFCADGPSTNLP